jgi:proliferating cell nuclear antigen
LSGGRIFEIEIADARVWKKCVDALVNLVKEGAFEIDKEGITLRAIDPSQIAMVIFSMGKNEFSKYQVDQKTRLGVNMETLAKTIGRVRGKEKMSMKFDGKGRLNITFSGDKNKRSFNIPTIDVAPGPSKDLQIDYTATIKIKGGVFKDILKDAALVSPHVLLVADENKFRVEAEGDGGDVQLDYDQGEVDVHIKRTTSAVFSQEYLDDIAKGCDDDAELTLDLGAPNADDKRPKPLRVQYAFGNASFTYYLAPRIETD